MPAVAPLARTALVLLALARPALPVPEDPAAGASESVSAPLRIERGEGLVPLEIPRRERLQFNVRVGLGLGTPQVGTMTLETGVEPYRESLLVLGTGDGDGAEIGWIRALAQGGTALYEVRHEMEARYLPQTWPSSILRSTQTGSENKRREISVGVDVDDDDGDLRSEYVSDGHCKGCTLRSHYVESSMPWGDPHHCDDCKRAEHRVWKPARRRAAPAGTVDMLGALYLSRAMAARDLRELELLLLDRTDLWAVSLTRGERRLTEVPAGTFEVVELVFDTKPAPGEPPEDDKRFEGLFGIKGSIHLWIHPETGVIVQVTGTVPAGPFDVEARIDLAAFSGTPPAFRPATSR